MIDLRRGTMTALATAGVLLAACGDDNNTPTQTSTQFTAAEKQALATAFVNTGLIPSGDATTAQLSSLLLGGVKSYSKITIPAALRAAPTSGLRLAKISGEYDATGLQYKFDISINGQPAVQGISAGLVAWSGLNVTAQTVDDWISIGASDETATDFPAAVNGVVPNDVYAEYYLASTETLYEGISGNASITKQTFGTDVTNCSVTTAVGTLNCTYRYGTMEGAFDFVGQPVFTTGDNVTFASTSYSVPAVRVTLSGNFTVPVAQQAALTSALRKMVQVR